MLFQAGRSGAIRGILWDNILKVCLEETTQGVCPPDPRSGHSFPERIATHLVFLRGLVGGSHIPSWPWVEEEGAESRHLW